MGVVSKFKRAFEQLRKVSKLEEEIETLFLLLNRSTDITACKLAEGELRDLQLCDYQLLRIFDKICKENHWDYWLEFGTLLGAVRHKGFIPWDDDMDIAVPRSVYDDMKDTLPQILSPYGIDVTENDVMARIGIGYRHSDTGVWIDIFPHDFFETTEDSKQLIDKAYEWRKIYGENKDILSEKELKDLKEKHFGFSNNSNRKVFVSLIEFLALPTIRDFDYDWVFPLKKMTFEGLEFNVPFNYDEYLRRIYGNYMEYPKSGILTHGEAAPLYKWAERSGTNMHDVYSELKQIADNI